MTKKNICALCFDQGMVDGDEQNDSWASDQEDACDEPAPSRQSNLSDKIGDVTVKADVDADGGTVVYFVA